MAKGIQDWSLTASSNGNADSNINWAEGQSPPTINNSARAMMAALRAFYNAVGGGISYSGSAADVYVATNDSPGAWTAYAEGQIIGLEPSHTNTGASTINVDGLGAKAIAKGASTALAAGDLVAGAFYLLRYDGTRFQIVGSPVTGSYQPLDATLTALAALSTSASQYIRATGTDTFTMDSYATVLSNIGAVPTTRTLTAGTGIDTIGDLSANRTIAINQAFTATWTGAHTFRGNANLVTFDAATATSAVYFKITSTGGNKFIGVESSAGSSLISGGTAYALCFVTESSRPMQWATNNTLAMTLDTSQNLTVVGTVTGSSDRRLKTDIEDLTEAAAVAFVRALRPRTFYKRGVALCGFIAQEVAEVDQRYVFETEDADKTLAIPAGAEWAAPIVRTLQYLLERDAR